MVVVQRERERVTRGNPGRDSTLPDDDGSRTQWLSSIWNYLRGTKILLKTSPVLSGSVTTSGNSFYWLKSHKESVGREGSEIIYRHGQSLDFLRAFSCDVFLHFQLFQAIYLLNAIALVVGLGRWDICRFFWTASLSHKGRTFVWGMAGTFVNQGK